MKALHEFGHCTSEPTCISAFAFWDFSWEIRTRVLFFPQRLQKRNGLTNVFFVLKKPTYLMESSCWFELWVFWPHVTNNAFFRCCRKSPPNNMLLTIFCGLWTKRNGCLPFLWLLTKPHLFNAVPLPQNAQNLAWIIATLLYYSYGRQNLREKKSTVWVDDCANTNNCQRKTRMASLLTKFKGRQELRAIAAKASLFGKATMKIWKFPTFWGSSTNNDCVCVEALSKIS